MGKAYTCDICGHMDQIGLIYVGWNTGLCRECYEQYKMIYARILEEARA